MKGHTYANVIQKSNPTGNNNNNKTYKYRALIEQLFHLKPKNWPKFQELLKRTAAKEKY